MTDRTLLDRLTEREKEPLRLWLQHKTAKEIAIELGISHHAVEKRLKMARTKLDVATSLEAARLLDAAEGSGQPVAQAPDLSHSNAMSQSLAPKPVIIGAILVSLIAAIALALSLSTGATDRAADDQQRLTQLQNEELHAALFALISAAEIGPDGEVFLTSAMGDPRYLEAGSGYYWQIEADGHEPFTSRSLWDRQLDPMFAPTDGSTGYYVSDQFSDESLRVAAQRVQFPGHDTLWTFRVARPRAVAN